MHLSPTSKLGYLSFNSIADVGTITVTEQTYMLCTVASIMIWIEKYSGMINCVNLRRYCYQTYGHLKVCFEKWTHIK